MIRSTLLIRCFSSIKAHFYINELNRRGIYAFLLNEHTTDLIPFGDGGYLVHVNMDQLAEAVEVIEELEAEEKKEQDFTEATMEDIEYEKLKTERKEKMENNKGMIILLVIIVILLVKYLMDGKIL